jgi:SLT domain-containing protein
LTNTLNALGIHGFDLPGVLNNLTGAVFSQIKTAATNWISSVLPKFSFGSSPTSTPGNVQSWIAQAMSLTGAPASWAGALDTIAMHESGGNPNAENDWDSNAAAGDPSRGLFQTIGSTFAAYMLPGHTNIMDPVSNAAAAIRYIMAVYGSVFNTPGIVSMSKGGPYLGYANGTNFNPVTGDYVVGERGPEILRIPRGASVTPNSQIGSYNDNSQVIARLDRLISLMENGLTLDGQRLTRAQMPYIVSEIRNKTNTRF